MSGITVSRVPAIAPLLGRFQKPLLLCGVAASVTYLLADVLATNRWQGYSYRDQAVSELMAIGAPTRPLIVGFFMLCTALSLGFAAGAFASVRGRRSVLVACWLFTAYTIVGAVACLFFPMHLRGATGSLTDAMHIAITMFLVLSMFLFIGFGSDAGGTSFRVYSWLTIVLLLGFGVWAGMDGTRLAHNLPTPWLGIKERVNIYGCLLWIAMFARVLMREETRE